MMMPLKGIYNRVIKYGWSVVDFGKMNNGYMFFDIKGTDGLTRRVIFKENEQEPAEQQCQNQ